MPGETCRCYAREAFSGNSTASAEGSGSFKATARAAGPAAHGAEGQGPLTQSTTASECAAEGHLTLSRWTVQTQSRGSFTAESGRAPAELHARAWHGHGRGRAPRRRPLCAQSCPTLGGPGDCSPPVSSVHGVFQKEYWSGQPFPTPGDLPNSGIGPVFLVSPPQQADSLPPTSCEAPILHLILAARPAAFTGSETRHAGQIDGISPARGAGQQCPRGGKEGLRVVRRGTPAPAEAGVHLSACDERALGSHVGGAMISCVSSSLTKAQVMTPRRASLQGIWTDPWRTRHPRRAQMGVPLNLRGSQAWWGGQEEPALLCQQNKLLNHSARLSPERGRGESAHRETRSLPSDLLRRALEKSLQSWGCFSFSPETKEQSELCFRPQSTRTAHVGDSSSPRAKKGPGDVFKQHQDVLSVLLRITLLKGTAPPGRVRGL